MARNGSEILFDTLLKAAGMEPEAFKRDIYAVINAVKMMDSNLRNIDARLHKLELQSDNVCNALHIPTVSSDSVRDDNPQMETKQLTNGSAAKGEEYW